MKVPKELKEKMQKIALLLIETAQDEMSHAEELLTQSISLQKNCEEMEVEDS